MNPAQFLEAAFLGVLFLAGFFMGARISQAHDSSRKLLPASKLPPAANKAYSGPYATLLKEAEHIITLHGESFEKIHNGQYGSVTHQFAIGRSSTGDFCIWLGVEKGFQPVGAAAVRAEGNFEMLQYLSSEQRALSREVERLLELALVQMTRGRTAKALDAEIKKLREPS